jgi:flagellar assembly protein FliH
MSSFDALVPARVEGEAGAFVPLRPPGSEEPSSAEAWRPLCGDAGAEESAFAGAAGAAPAADVEGGPGAAGTTLAAAARTAARAGASATPSGGPGGDPLAAAYERGRRDAEAEVEGAAQALAKSVEALDAFRTALRRRCEEELLDLAVGVAEKVLRAELRERPEAWLDMIRDGVRHAVDREQVRVRVPAALAAFLRDRLPALRARLEDVKELEVVEDPALDAGGCVVETRFGELDLGIAAQVEQLRRGLGEET